MVSSDKSRRTHNKSRMGCAECKRRHIKCDEQRPVCVNCSVSRRPCDYPCQVPKVPEPPWGRSVPVDEYSSPSPLNDDPEQFFTLEHFSLFHHIETGMDDWFAISEFMRPLCQVYFKAALESPYIMNQFLGIAALHLSHIHPSKSQVYHRMATELQTRGLIIFKRTRTDGDATLRFIFSTLVAVHVLAEKLADHQVQDISTFLREFTEQINIHQGGRIVGQGIWNEIADSDLKEWLLQVDEDCIIDNSYVSRSQEEILSMLQSSHLDQEAIDACKAASEALDFSRRRLHSRRSWGPHAPLAWINLISQEFICLLKENVPEALVILAHYAELLHQCCDFWVFGNVGEYLIRGISAILGPPWARWLSIPANALAPSAS